MHLIDRKKELGRFIKTKRNNITPESLGLPRGNRRRTPGLRREEVAQMSGVGITWYTWLEQGRDIQVSQEVLVSIARVLKLTEVETRHMLDLGNPQASSYETKKRTGIDPIVQRVLDSLHYSPAFVMDKSWNILAWNEAAIAVFGDFETLNKKECNMIWLMFKAPNYRKLFVDWDHHARGIVARFRSSISHMIAEPNTSQFINDLCQSSDIFNTWWHSHEVEDNTVLTKKLQHPIMGELIFDFCSLEISGKSDLTIIINTPAPDTSTSDSIKSYIKPERSISS